MSKIDLKAHLKTSDTDHIVNTTGILLDDKITYFDGDVSVTVIKDDSLLILKRRHIGYDIELRFKIDSVTQGCQTMKEFPMEIELKIKTKEMSIKDGSIKIVYDLYTHESEMVEYTYILEYEVRK